MTRGPVSLEGRAAAQNQGFLGLQIWGYYGTHYRIRLYPPFEYGVLSKEYYLTGFNHQKNTTQMCRARKPVQETFTGASGLSEAWLPGASQNAPGKLQDPSPIYVVAQDGPNRV